MCKMDIKVENNFRTERLRILFRLMNKQCICGFLQSCYNKYTKSVTSDIKRQKYRGETGANLDFGHFFAYAKENSPMRKFFVSKTSNWFKSNA